MPDVLPTVAIPGDPLVHTPPEGELPNVILPPIPTIDGPVIALGKGLTVITVVIEQPDDNVYVIVAVPKEAPVTKPLVRSTVATVGLLLIHVPPSALSNNVTDDPRQTICGPPIGPGVGRIVNVVTLVHPGDAVYEITVMPAATPVAIPVKGFIEPVVGSLLLHVPPTRPPATNAPLAPTHKLTGPVTGGGAGLTVITVVAKLVPIIYEIIAVPIELPVTKPAGLTDATAEELLLQEPPTLVSVKVIVPPTQTVELPVMGPMAKDPKERNNDKNVRISLFFIR